MPCRPGVGWKESGLRVSVISVGQKEERKKRDI